VEQPDLHVSDDASLPVGRDRQCLVCGAQYSAASAGEPGAQLWQLAVHWYANRLTVESRRPAPDEMISIFASLGLTGPFWDPKSDQWK
jgi:hypothetical protein